MLCTHGTPHQDLIKILTLLNLIMWKQILQAAHQYIYITMQVLGHRKTGSCGHELSRLLMAGQHALVLTSSYNFCSFTSFPQDIINLRHMDTNSLGCPSRIITHQLGHCKTGSCQQRTLSAAHNEIPQDIVKLGHVERILSAPHHYIYHQAGLRTL